MRPVTFPCKTGSSLPYWRCKFSQYQARVKCMQKTKLLELEMPVLMSAVRAIRVGQG